VKRSTWLQWLVSIFLLTLLLVPAIRLWADSATTEKVLSAGEEVRVPVDCQSFKYIDIRLENLMDSESVCWRTSFFQGKERGEREIGPLLFRTIKLKKKEKDKTKDVRFDRRTITLDCKITDEVVIHVDKGKVLVKVTQEK